MDILECISISESRMDSPNF